MVVFLPLDDLVEAVPSGAAFEPGASRSKSSDYPKPPCDGWPPLESREVLSFVPGRASGWYVVDAQGAIIDGPCSGEGEAGALATAYNRWAYCHHPQLRQSKTLLDWLGAVPALFKPSRPEPSRDLGNLLHRSVVKV